VIMERTLTAAEKALSRSSRTSSSTHSTILRKKAQLEANKTKAKYAEQQVEILRRKLELDAELSLIQIKQEAEALETEIRVMESESILAEDIDSVSNVREERTRQYVEKHFVNIDDPAISKNTLCHATTTTPVVTSSDQVSTCAAPEWSPITSHSQTLLSNVIGTGLNTNQHMQLPHVITSHPILTGSYTQPVTQITHPFSNPILSLSLL